MELNILNFIFMVVLEVILKSKPIVTYTLSHASTIVGGRLVCNGVTLLQEYFARWGYRINKINVFEGQASIA